MKKNQKFMEISPLQKKNYFPGLDEIIKNRFSEDNFSENSLKIEYLGFFREAVDALKILSQGNDAILEDIYYIIEDFLNNN